MSLSMWSLSSRNCCRERAPSRRRRVAATISRIAANGAICLFLARRAYAWAARPVTPIGSTYAARRGRRCAPMWRKPFSEGALLCGFCDDHGQVKTVGTRRAGFLPSLQHLLDEAGKRTALTMPPCSCHLIWQTAARSPAPNLRYFCPSPAQTGRCSEPHGQGSSGLSIAVSGKMGAARRLGVSAPTRRGAS
jgi:hypothetical protein